MTPLKAILSSNYSAFVMVRTPDELRILRQACANTKRSHFAINRERTIYYCPTKDVVGDRLRKEMQLGFLYPDLTN